MKSNVLLTLIGLALYLGTSATSFASSVALNWNLNSEPDLAGYRIYYKADSPDLPFDGVGATEGPAPIDFAIQSSATIDGLDPGRTYYFAVTAYNTEGFESIFSNVVAKVPPLDDTTAPDIVSFTIPPTATSRTISIMTFTASDNVGVTGYLLTPSVVTIPAAADAGWSATAPLSYTFASEGSLTLYAWVKDNAGNISNAIGRTVTVTLPDLTAPAISTFTIPTTSSSLTVVVSTLSATDAFGVTGYLITESATKPAAGASGWSATVPTSFTFSTAGSKIAYAWAKDAAGNVSSSRTAAVTITLPDTTAPVVNAFTMPTTATSLTVAVFSITATDTVGVTGYLITESATKPAANASGWTASASTSFTFSAAGSKTGYAWAKDAAGNVSSSLSASITITLPDISNPKVYNFTISDALLALRIAVGAVTPTSEQRIRADVAPVDGKIDISDALGILRDVVGIKKILL